MNRGTCINCLGDCHVILQMSDGEGGLPLVMQSCPSLTDRDEQGGVSVCIPRTIAEVMHTKMEDGQPAVDIHRSLGEESLFFISIVGPQAQRENCLRKLF